MQEKMISVLAIDPATTSGFAVRKISGWKKFETKRGDSPGMRFLLFRAWLEVLIQEHNPDVIFYERQHHRGGAATEIALGFVTEIKTVAAQKEIEVKSEHTKSIKKWASGNGNAKKIQMIEAANRLRPSANIDEDNEADAICLYEYAINEVLYKKKRRIKRRIKRR
jgi:Holliday junction resolvasome RuvABC endonuclease subunit